MRYEFSYEYYDTIGGTSIRFFDLLILLQLVSLNLSGNTYKPICIKHKDLVVLK